MDETRGHFAKWNKLEIERKNTAWSHLYVKLKNVKYMEAENTIVITKDKEVGEMGDVGKRV